jgi:quaternary ammonium compound-resistance protein SugE
MDWVYLVTAGLLEVAFATSLKASDNFSKPLPTVLFLVFSVASFALLSMAIRTIPVGTAYAVWTGIGACGTAAVGILAFGEPAGAARLTLLVLLIACVVGLKVVAPAESGRE